LQIADIIHVFVLEFAEKSPKREKSLLFSLLAGNSHVETGSARLRPPRGHRRITPIDRLPKVGGMTIPVPACSYRYYSLLTGRLSQCGRGGAEFQRTGGARLMSESTPQPKRWTRDYIFDILRELGIHSIFGVPGTNEIPIIDGTSDPENRVQYIECLHENIAIGAASGAARMTGKPGILVVHVTPGIAHSIGNLFNASRSRIPLVIICCQQQNELVTQEPLLASNLVELARQYTKWAHEVRTPDELPLVLQRAFKEAMAPPNGPVFLSIPWEFTIRSIGAEDRLRGVTRVPQRFTGDPDAIQKAADLLIKAANPIIVCGDATGCASAWPEVQKLAELLGAPVTLQTFSSVANFPNDDFHWQGELPSSQGGVQQVFQKHDVAFLCGFGAQAQIAVPRAAWAHR
jgi:benzoylformate decarboxylase